MYNAYHKLVLLAVIVALGVIGLGAYTRLSDAGLGCPDWPECYGNLMVPHTSSALQKAHAKFPGVKIEKAKAWKEMIHRYFAGALGVLILILMIGAIKRKKHVSGTPVLLPILLLLLVIFQAILGKWTVTWQVLPIVVTAHLLCGFLTLSFLWYLFLKTRSPIALPMQHLKIRKWIVVGLIITSLQIFLGAWTSTTYSSLACQDFPFCNGTLFPHMDFLHAFHLLQPIGINYEGGVLQTPARVTIHMFHRYEAAITALYWYGFALWIVFSSSTENLRAVAGWIVLFLTIQILLGVGNVLLSLPLGMAVGHTLMAALLLLAQITLLYKLNAANQLRTLY